MSAHTPGPWTYGHDGHGAYSIESDVCGGWQICYVRNEANARLIAASPDLLKVAQSFRQKLSTYVSVYPGDKELRRLLEECDAAIAKAVTP